MIKWETIVSTADEKITLLQWLKMVEKAINDGALTGISVQQADASHATITFSFAGDPEQSFTLTLPQGEQGKPGSPGPEGKEGKKGLDVLSITSETLLPYRVKEEPTSLTNLPLAAFSRTPVVGDNFLMTFKGFGAVLGRSWVGVCTVSYVGAAVNATVFAVETTGEQGKTGAPGEPGPQGEAGETKYTHNVTILNKDGTEGFLSFSFVNTVSTPYTDLSEIFGALYSLGYSNESDFGGYAMKSASGCFDYISNNEQMLGISIGEGGTELYYVLFNNGVNAGSIPIADIIDDAPKFIDIVE